jgi:hypothetical protein
MHENSVRKRSCVDWLLRKQPFDSTQADRTQQKNSRLRSACGDAHWHRRRLLQSTKPGAHTCTPFRFQSEHNEGSRSAIARRRNHFLPSRYVRTLLPFAKSDVGIGLDQFQEAFMNPSDLLTVAKIPLRRPTESAFYIISASDTFCHHQKDLLSPKISYQTLFLR